MENALKDKEFIIGEERKSFMCADNGIYQDGTTPVYRDVDGKLWAMSGHSHVGHISMLSGTTMKDLKEMYPIQTTFTVGKAGEAFNGIRYPEGIESRGSVWPFGLYICPKTHRFFAFFHNETGWAGHGTAYDALGLCETPYHDSDFRHVGLMHSDDEGRTWTFDRWVLTADTVCFTEKYNPNSDIARGQKYGRINLGSGDFSCYVEEDGDYIYLFYNIIYINLETGKTEDIDVYVARSRKRDDGMMGDFVKYYNGSFSEAGNFGKETPIVQSAWHARVIKLKDLGVYMMTYANFRKNSTYVPNDGSSLVERAISIRTSEDMLTWSEPIQVYKDGEKFGNHYCAFYTSNDKECFDVTGNDFVIQLNGNGTDVMQYDVKIVDKENT